MMDGDRSHVELRAQRSDYRRSLELMLVQRLGGGKVAFGKPVEMEEYDEFVYVSDPTLQLSEHAAQLLIDDLWTCGYRPSEGTGSVGALKAVQDHVKDLRKIVFKTMEIPND